ncbi:O-antigen ligase family protein [Qipengyuania spongiae]|uniref:O-antigen ligase family protein n=1 Tax=Qipengyuania spongiae TaxID=2909673 RepID=A0ABY5T2T0_9SPHN|nr:O-antigen ligase family protein [Qipengyuania spongiae]UVI40844.1 O-antigen ligase family protein [Qipengyuania spongiae]
MTPAYSKRSSGHSPRPVRRFADRDIASYLMIAMLVIAAFLGGASREDSLAQPAIRLVMPILLAGVVLFGSHFRWRELREPLLLLGVLALVITAMLIPLPPEIWANLPGRDLIVPAAPLTGMPQPWRPWAISPPLAQNALFALIPPACVLIGAGFLSPSRRAALAFPFLVLILASAVLGVIQLAGGAGGALRWYAITNPQAGVGFFANRNHQALLLSMGLPLLGFWALRSGASRDNRSMRLWIAGFGALLLVVAILTTGSRAGLVVGAMALLGTATIHARTAVRLLGRLRPVVRWAIILGFIGTATILAILLFLSPQAQSISRLFGLDPAADLRITALPTMLEMARVYFPAGTGFGGFEPVFRAAEPFDLLSRNYVNEAHNDFLQLAIEGGIAGLLVLALALVWLTKTAWWLVRARDGIDDATQLGRTGVLIVLMIGAASIVDYPVRTPLIMISLVLACIWMTLARAQKRTV